MLDSSALLALFFGEAGEGFVGSVLYRSAVGAVNYCEALAKLIQKRATPSEARERLSELHLVVVAFDEHLALEGADPVRLAQRHGLSFGDRACLTLARRLEVPAVTADCCWKIPGLGVKVRLIR